MVIYEVNLQIDPAIFTEYYQWLLQHVKTMLTFAGFQKAEIGLVEDQTSSTKCLRVSYSVRDYQDLQNYFHDHADSMRAEGLAKFNNQFTATRRIVLQPLTLEANQ